MNNNHIHTTSIILLIILICIIACTVHCRPAHTTNTGGSGNTGNPNYATMDLYDDDPTEIEASMCSIVTDKITATANATISRQLKGVCKSREVREQLRHIELSIHRELRRIITYLQVNNKNKGQHVVFKYLPNRPT